MKLQEYLGRKFRKRSIRLNEATEGQLHLALELLSKKEFMDGVLPIIEAFREYEISEVARTEQGAEARRGAIKAFDKVLALRELVYDCLQAEKKNKKT